MNVFEQIGTIELKKDMGITGVTDEFFCVLLYSTLQREKKNILVGVNSLYEANQLYSSLTNYTDNVSLFPMDDFLTSEALAVSPELRYNRLETINKVKKANSQLLHQNGKEPTPEEIADFLDMPTERVREILRVAQEPVSLETPIGEEEDSHLGDFIPDDDALAPADAASMSLLKEQLADVLKTLTPREEKVLSLRFGLADGNPKTLEEVGKEFNVTRERIRQIEAKALRKLRHPSRSKKLKDFLD